MFGWWHRFWAALRSESDRIAHERDGCGTLAKLVTIRMAKLKCSVCGNPFSDGDVVVQLFGVAGETLIHEKCASPELRKEAGCSS